MKRHCCWVLGFAFLGAVWFSLLAPHATGQGTPSQTSDSPAGEDPYKRALEHYNQQAKQEEEQAKRGEALLAREENLVKKQEEAFKRYERILETWERQQQQYQKYLDALPKK